MAFEQSELAQIGEFFKTEIGSVEKRLMEALDSKVAAAVGDAVPATPEPADRASVVGTPDVDPEAGPAYYVHLADGSVVESKDSQSTHMPNAEGVPVQVIGRYQKGE